MSRDLGIDVRIGGPIMLKLLPRPRVIVMDVSAHAPDGSIDLSAPAVLGELDVAALLRGHWRLISATLSDPTMTIDIDRAGQAFLRADDAQTTSAFRVTLRSGLARVLSRQRGADTLVTDLSGTVEKGEGRKGGVSASGGGTWHGMPERLTLDIGVSSGTGAQRQFSADVRVTSPAGWVSASGHVTGGEQPQFSGRLTASSNAPWRILAALGRGDAWPDMRKFALAGSVVARAGEVSLSEAVIRLNAAEFEGTLGYRTDGGRDLVEGTLAARRLDLEGLAGRSLDRASLDAMYRSQLVPHLADTNLDLRMSASEVVIGDVVTRDVALSLLCRDSRLEVTLDEALAFGGVMKARLLGLLSPDDIEAHADLTLSDVELGTLDVAVTGEERLSGTVSAKVVMDGHGKSLMAIVPTLAGEGQVSVSDGTFIGMSVPQALRRLSRKLPYGRDEPGQLTSFTAASSALRIADGTIHFVDGRVTGPGISLAFGGHGDLPHGRIDIFALASPTDAEGALIAGAPGLPIEMRGAWGVPWMLMEQGRHLSLPTLLLPEVESGRNLP